MMRPLFLTISIVSLIPSPILASTVTLEPKATLEPRATLTIYARPSSSTSTVWITVTRRPSSTAQAWNTAQTWSAWSTPQAWSSYDGYGPPGNGWSTPAAQQTVDAAAASRTVDVSSFPTCAVANCITSNQLSPARLGCHQPYLTVGCLCRTAPMPLACAPYPPSDEDNCWYELEDWLAGVCAPLGGAPMLNTHTIPWCKRTCVLVALGNMGCRNPTRSCFCELPKDRVVEAANSCHCDGGPAFDASLWRDGICVAGQTEVTDGAYVKNSGTRLGVPGFLLRYWASLLVWFFL